MLAPSPRVPVRWPSKISLADSTCSHDSGCLSPSAAMMPGALNVFRAAEAGDLHVISSYLSGGGNVNRAGKEGYSILHLATMRNQEPMVKLLLERGADPDVHDYQEGLTPLMWAAQLGHASVAVSLLEGGADSEQEDREDLTALHWAVRLGKERVVVVLLDHHADVEAMDYDGNTPLIWGAREGHRACVNLLLDHGAVTTTPDENGNTALHFSCQAGHSGITSDLLDWGALATAQDYWQFTPFHRACSQGHGNVLVELLRAREPGGDKPGGDGGAGGGVFGARATGGWGERGGGVTAWAGRRGNDPAPALGLPSNVIDLRNHFHATPLHRAAAKGHAEVVSMLLENGANVNARDGFYYTPLHLACVNGAVSCVDILLRAGADPSTRAQGGVTPLLAARKPEIRDLLGRVLDAWSAVSGGVSWGLHRGSVGSSSASASAATDRTSIDSGASNDGACGVAGGEARRRGRAGEGSGGDGSGGDGKTFTALSAAAVSACGRGEGVLAGNAAAEMDSERAGNCGGPRAGAVRVRTLPIDAAAAAAAAATVEPLVGATQAKRGPLLAVDMDVDGDNGGWCEMMMPAAASPCRGEPLRVRGRPVSRLPPQEVSAGPRRPRRSSTGSMLFKIFNSAPGQSSTIKHSMANPPAASAPRLAGAAFSPSAAAAAAAATTPVVLGLSPCAIPPPPGAQAPTLAMTQGIPCSPPPSTAPSGGSTPPLARAARVAISSADEAASSDPEKEIDAAAAGSPSVSAMEVERGPADGDVVGVPAACQAPSESLLDAAPPPPPLPISATVVAEDTLPRYIDAVPLLGAAAPPCPVTAAVAAQSVSTILKSASLRSSTRSSLSVTFFSPPLFPPQQQDGDGASKRLLGVKKEGDVFARDVKGVNRGRQRAGVSAQQEEATPDATTAAHKKRRAKSLPPSWEGDEQSARRRRGGGQQPRPPRKPRLESRPCMDGPTAVIEGLTLDDALADDNALSCWLEGTWAGAVAVEGGESPLPSPTVLAPRRATTLVG